MKYQKGTFIVIPNKEYLKGRTPQFQSVFFWLCAHADEDGICYPSRSTLAKEAGCGVKIVDRVLKVMEDCGYIKKTTRLKPNSKENLSNLYQIMIIDPTPVSPEPHPSVNLDTTPRDTEDTVTISNINSIQLTKVSLPLTRGKSPVSRLLSIYCSLFIDKFGVSYKGSIPMTLKQFKDLLLVYSEIQIAVLLIVYFNWQGMGGDNFKDQDFLCSIAFPPTAFRSSISKYEVYARNVMGVPFDDDEKLLPIVGKHITSLKGYSLSTENAV